jgi:hypothetical protein
MRQHLQPRHWLLPRRGMIARIIPLAALVLSAACGDREPLTAPADAHARALQERIASLNALGRKDRSYQAQLTVYEVAEGGTERIVASRSRRIGSLRTTSVALDSAGLTAAAAGATLWEEMLTRHSRRADGPASRVGSWSDSRPLRADPSVVVVRQGNGRAPAVTTSIYKGGVLYGQIREQWRRGSEQWELTRREMIFPGRGLRAVAEFTHAPVFTLDLVRPNSAARALPPTLPTFDEYGGGGGCTAEEAEVVCADEKLDAEEATDALIFHTFYTITACGTAVFATGTTVIGGIVTGSTCAMMVLEWLSKAEKEKREWQEWRECLARAQQPRIGVPTGGETARAGLSTAPSYDLRAHTPPAAPSFACDGAGVDGGDDEPDVTCYYYIEYDLETGIVYYVQLLYCVTNQT